jgi:transcriptional regulator with XRE-family HTH domain
MTSTGTIIKMIRKDCDKTLKEMSGMLNISVGHLSNVERNRRRISFDDFVRILRVVGYEIEIKKVKKNE